MDRASAQADARRIAPIQRDINHQPVEWQHAVFRAFTSHP